MPYETQSQWTIDELKKLNKATLIGMHKAYLALIIVSWSDLPYRYATKKLIENMDL